MTDETPRCVVCGSTVNPASAHYPNSWEATVKTRLCCSETCRANFDVDRHWIPSCHPSPAQPGNESHLTTDARRRLGRGDDHRAVVRELLCAGVTVVAIEHMLRMGEVPLYDARRMAESAAPVEVVGKLLTHGPLSVLVALFRGESKRAAVEREANAAQSLAIADLDAWRAAWARPEST